MINLNDFVCMAPFTNLEIHEHSNFMCCPSWISKELPGDIPLKDVWNSENSKEIRKTIMSGEYKYCDKISCPYLSELIKLEKLGNISPIIPKKIIPEIVKNNYNSETGEMNMGPLIVQYSFDRTCNYHCPSCRIEVVGANTNEKKIINAKINEIEETFGKDLVSIYITGSGDPFVSSEFRNYLRNFNPEKYPNFKGIHLHTNASLWNKEMWDSMYNIHKFVRTCEISIDAGTKETYENLTRLGGNWDNLMNNLKFINTIPNLHYISTSFVVQSHNYMEMKIFLDLMKNIFGKKVHVYFGRILNWGHLSEGEYKLLKIWDKTHPEHRLFLDEFSKVYKDSQVFHNLHDFIELNKTLI